MSKHCLPGRGGEHEWTYEGESRTYHCRKCGFDPYQESLEAEDAREDEDEEDDQC